MKQSNYSNQGSNTTQKDKYTNQSNRDKYGSVEPLPESSRPRRDGPGGEDAK